MDKRESVTEGENGPEKTKTSNGRKKGRKGKMEENENEKHQGTEFPSSRRRISFLPVSVRWWAITTNKDDVGTRTDTTLGREK
jgi:hypothetical protein